MIKIRYVLLGLIIGLPAAIISKWPIYGDYWTRVGFWGVIRNDVIGHALGMVLALTAGLLYITLEHYG